MQSLWIHSMKPRVAANRKFAQEFINAFAYGHPLDTMSQLDIEPYRAEPGEGLKQLITTAICHL